jgi:hypothetical protein
MAIKQTGVAAHDSVCNQAELVRQNAVAVAGNSQSAVKAAELTFYRTVLSSARQNNMSADIAGVLEALRELGVLS